jgi:hypothetical protein
MKTNDTRNYDGSLVGQHELQWKVTVPLGVDEALTELNEEDTIVKDSDFVYAAIAIPSEYKVTT